MRFNDGHLPQGLPRHFIPEVWPVLPLRPELEPALLRQLQRQVEFGESVGCGGWALRCLWHIHVLRRDRGHILDRGPHRPLAVLPVDFLAHCLRSYLCAFIYETDTQRTHTGASHTRAHHRDDALDDDDALRLFTAFKTVSFIIFRIQNNNTFLHNDAICCLLTTKQTQTEGGDGEERAPQPKAADSKRGRGLKRV